MIGFIIIGSINVGICGIIIIGYFIILLLDENETAANTINSLLGLNKSYYYKSGKGRKKYIDLNQQIL